MIDSLKEVFLIEMVAMGEWIVIDRTEDFNDALALASAYAEHLEDESRVRIIKPDGTILI
jgi:hypothetical protein